MNPTFSIEIVITNKPQARDPEGETIMRDLIHRNGLSSVKEVRTGKLLTINLEASNEEEAPRTLHFSPHVRAYVTLRALLPLLPGVAPDF